MRLFKIYEKKQVGDKLKINCDGAFNAADGTGGWGFVIRDSEGDVRGSGAGWIRNAATATRAEAEACAAALQAASEWGMVNVEVESDCQVLVKAVKSKDYDLAQEGMVF